MTEETTNRIIEFTRHLNPYELREEIEEEVLNSPLSAIIAGLEAVAQDEEHDEEVRNEAEDILQELEGKHFLLPVKLGKRGKQNHGRI